MMGFGDGGVLSFICLHGGSSSDGEKVSSLEIMTLSRLGERKRILVFS